MWLAYGDARTLARLARNSGGVCTAPVLSVAARETCVHEAPRQGQGGRGARSGAGRRGTMTRASRAMADDDSATNDGLGEAGLERWVRGGGVGGRGMGVAPGVRDKPPKNDGAEAGCVWLFGPA